MPIGFIGTTDAKYDQTAKLLRQGYDPSMAVTEADEILINPEDAEAKGQFVIEQHPVTGEYIRRWKPAEVDIPGDIDGDFGAQSLGTQPFTFKCQARSIITGGLNSQGTTQRWTSSGLYENVDYVELQVPRDVIVTKRDRITNITNSRGEIVWREEEHGTFEPTVFTVRGVAPSLDPFGSLMEWFILLERSEIQGGTEGSRNEQKNQPSLDDGVDIYNGP